MICIIGRSAPKIFREVRALTELLDMVIFTHQPTWDDCQHLRQILFTTEERERITSESQEVVPGENDTLTTNPLIIDTSFPLARHNLDFTIAEGKGKLQIYPQTLRVGWVS